ncbi:MAG: FAD/NAD(P)-binding protein [Chloroherpetonaceae bacterium]|nr:FAD/NAD(P)-binding protein [bacterium]
MNSQNIYLPYKMRIEKITEEAPMVKTFKLAFVNPEDESNFEFKTGQFGEYSVFGAGESTFCIASSPTHKGYIECTFREAGRVTTALYNCEEGDIIGFRGPYGNNFPLEEWEGKSILFIAGGIGLPPVRSVIWNCLDLRDKFKDITILYGAKTVQDLVYKNELEEWAKRPDVKLITTVDPGGETPDWKGEVGFVPSILKKASPKGENAVAIVCGPPIMIKLTLPILLEIGFTEESIFTTLENRMKCGIGQCGHCAVGPYYVCKDGPVINYADLQLLPVEY